MADCALNPASPETAAFIHRFGSRRLDLTDRTLFPCVDTVNGDYAIFYQPLNRVPPLSLRSYAYYSIPGLFSLLDNAAMEAAGILPIRSSPALGNGGDGVLIGLVDTGIDYTNPLFQNPDGATRIVSIWDQTAPAGENERPPGVPDYFPQGGASYGTEYTREQINAALQSEDPFSLVPSRDELGHGTYLAGTAAGNELPGQDFTGAAPHAELIVVKLKPAAPYLRDFYLAPPGVPAYQENDIMMGVKYLRVKAAAERRPLVILLALGSSLGSHEGSSPLSSLFQSFSGSFGVVSVIAAGNETGRARHVLGEIPPQEEFTEIELRVGAPEEERGFALEFWAAGADTYSVGFLSPGGERIGRIPVIADNETKIPFLLEPTTITVNYQLIEAGSGRQLIFMRFERPAAGIWKLHIYNTRALTGRFNLWLPSGELISEETRFLAPDPEDTVTLPGTAPSPITVGAYDHANGSLYIHSGRGSERRPAIKPDLTAPGVAVYGPTAGPYAVSRRDVSPSAGADSISRLAFLEEAQRQPAAAAVPRLPLVPRTGTSAAAAITAGAAACLLSWGIVAGNDPAMSETSVKSYLIRGAGRSPARSYPNVEWGYGTLNLLDTFLRLRE